MTMHQNYIYIVHFYYNFRLQLMNDAIIEVDCYMDDENKVNVAPDIEEVRDIILALMPRFHTALETQHQCLDPVDEETTKIRINQCSAKCTGELIIMVYASNDKPMLNIEVSSVLEIHRQLIIDSFQIGNNGSVSAEEMILNFMHNMDLSSYNLTLYFITIFF